MPKKRSVRAWRWSNAQTHPKGGRTSDVSSTVVLEAFYSLLFAGKSHSTAKHSTAKHSPHRSACAPGYASPSHAPSRSLHCASHTRTLVYITLDTHAACLRSLASLARDAHMHAHVQRCLDIFLFAVCLHGGRATGSRIHARGLLPERSIV